MIKDLFETKDTSLLIIQIEKLSNTLIGVPHHTPGGTPSMPCQEHKNGDENTGYIGDYIAKELSCSFICACNYFLNPNKRGKSRNKSDYYQAIIKNKPTYLIEIHGHGKKKEHSLNDVEISCGSKKKEKAALKLKEEIEKIIDKMYKKNPKWGSKLKKLKIEAEFDKIYFKAENTHTIQDRRWKAFHIELSPGLRIDKKTKAIPLIGFKFAELLSKAIQNVCNEK